MIFKTLSLPLSTPKNMHQQPAFFINLNNTSSHKSALVSTVHIISNLFPIIRLQRSIILCRSIVKESSQKIISLIPYFSIAHTISSKTRLAEKALVFFDITSLAQKIHWKGHPLLVYIVIDLFSIDTAGVAL